jgi:hypothetical protein
MSELKFGIKCKRKLFFNTINPMNEDFTTIVARLWISVKMQQDDWKKIHLQSTIQGRLEMTCQYDNRDGPRRCVVELEHFVNLNRGHSLMCCSQPIKSVRIEEGWRLVITYKSWNVCHKCSNNIPTTLTKSQICPTKNLVVPFLLNFEY